MKLGIRTKISGLALTATALAATSPACAQEPDVPAAIAPVTIDRAATSGLDLPKIDLPNKPGKEFYQKRVYRGEELSIFVLGGETIENVQTGFPIDEFIHYINGHAEIEAGGKSLTLLAGDYAIGPKGWAGTWTNHGGPRHNLELSIISTKRSEENSALSAPFRIEPKAIAGMTTRDLVDGRASDTVYEGPELAVSIATEAPGERSIAASSPETFVHILNGSVTVTPKGSEPVQFMVGDNFVLPTGFAGEWRVEGRNGVRVIEVVARV